ncbi:hypothetical protein [Candidatus Formimonas warabiya]|uniref:hypothetical protein n=1 Tax=Formimonas warabiya TaxID=1761012 RepID=UPI0011D07637|nr:hypothetical protein [Candidatus Formimonas warabiya]
MEKTLAQILSDKKGGPIDYNGKNVVMAKKIPVKSGQEVEIEILRFNGDSKQGFEVSIDQRKGYIEVNGQKLNSPIFWTDTAPRTFSFKCFPKKTEGIMGIWNVWKNIEYKENTDAWIGNAGLYVERIDDEKTILHCSNGIGDVNFDDLVLQIKIK